MFWREETLEQEHFKRDSGWNTQKEPVLEITMGLETSSNFWDLVKSEIG